MNKTLSLIVATCLLAGCASTSSIIDNNSETEPDIDKSTIPSGIFTYYDDPAQYHLPVEYFLTGRFVTQNDCLLFEANNELYTPILPAKYTKYTKGDAQIKVGNETYNIGETGDVSAQPLAKKYVGKFITEGPSHCLLDKFMRIEVRGVKSP
ncbi:YgdI/YgdR family lipoprotein [Psychrobacter faecalis]|uniref:hypothetical protein n=1 Tax=Psychrobacter faecalis TaxID=180588 RepID=UPI0018662388|nr:hypothetical protein [Psychrobacter faecalis]MBP6496862.1 hypothetical protein [Psychrobacter sp.]